MCRKKFFFQQIHGKIEDRETCKICLKKFTRLDKLKEHMMRHLKIKRYACRVCPKTYCERRDLTRHIVKMHSSLSCNTN